MSSTPILRGRLALAAMACALVAVSGCQSGDTLGALKLPGVGGGQGGQPPVQDDRISAQELTAYCPQVSIREAESIHRTYQRGGQDDPQKLLLQATMNDSTRSCTYGNGLLGMTIAVAGRVVPGPVATGGSVTLPIRVRVVQGADVIHDQTFNQEVVLTDTIGATQWVFADSSFSMPQPAQTNFRVFVGFAEQAAR